MATGRDGRVTSKVIMVAMVGGGSEVTVMVAIGRGGGGYGAVGVAAMAVFGGGGREATMRVIQRG